MKLSFKIFKKLKYWLLALLLLSSVWFMYAADDLLRQIIEPAFFQDTIIAGLGENVETVWNNVFHWGRWVSVNIRKQPKLDDEEGSHICKWWSCSDGCKKIIGENESGYEAQYEACKHEWKYSYVRVEAEREDSMIAKIIRFLLAFLVAISVTMILYNGMIYIVETWQGKEGKNLVKNIVYIVVWILIGLFSVVIIRLIQSIPYTLEQDTTYDVGQKIDREVIE